MMTLGTVGPVGGGPGWRSGAEFLGNGLVCGDERCFHHIELVSVNGTDLVVSECDFCFEFVAPPREIYCVWFELYEGDV